MKRGLAVGLAALLPLGLARAAPATPDSLVFVACPIYRDTDAGPKSGCWLADDPASGKRFDISDSPVKPDWNMGVLVEGKPSAAAQTACGGEILDPVRVSVLRDRRCTRVMLPGESFAGHRFKLPAHLIRPAYAPPEQFPHPYAPRRFEIPFTFDDAFLTYQLGDWFMNEAVAYALATHAKAVIITGWAATQPELASGEKLAETPQIAQARAELAVHWMRGLGVPENVLHVTWHGDPAPLAFDANDGMLAGSGRRVDVIVVPGES